ncbi:unnamed protein product [Citrullus colocynthis]|uniref:Secreted protein n=1 Tax=Citrullus colocynthis TaxID=252529 RepID=A0ABP0Z577_9ROSI
MVIFFLFFSSFFFLSSVSLPILHAAAHEDQLSDHPRCPPVPSRHAGPVPAGYNARQISLLRLFSPTASPPSPLFLVVRRILVFG